MLQTAAVFCDTALLSWPLHPAPHVCDSDLTLTERSASAG